MTVWCKHLEKTYRTRFTVIDPADVKRCMGADGATPCDGPVHAIAIATDIPAGVFVLPMCAYHFGASPLRDETVQRMSEREQ